MNNINNKHGPDRLLMLPGKKGLRDGSGGKPRPGTHGKPGEGNPGKPRDGNKGSPRDWITVNPRDGNPARSRDGTQWPPGILQTRSNPSIHWRETRWRNRLLEAGMGEVCLTASRRYGVTASGFKEN